MKLFLPKESLETKTRNKIRSGKIQIKKNDFRVVSQIPFEEYAKNPFFYYFCKPNYLGQPIYILNYFEKRSVFLGHSIFITLVINYNSRF